VGQIRNLPELLVNQIAAGEVVDRPAAALKELMENSLDAGAQSVSVDLTEGGVRRMRVADDGTGIDRDDLPLAVARFATSKIATLEDLERAATLGFRGEALASIGAVARLAIVSKRSGERHAWRIACEAGNVSAVEPAALAGGTTIDVEDLYFNTPARRKFLKSEATEFARCDEAFARIALSRPAVAFALTHNGRRTAHMPPEGARERASRLIGEDFAASAVEVHAESGAPAVSMGLAAGEPGFTRPFALTRSTSYVNRPLRARHRSRRTRSARPTPMSCTTIARHPRTCLFHAIDPRSSDVNVHPAKSGRCASAIPAPCTSSSSCLSRSLGRSRLRKPGLPRFSAGRVNRGQSPVSSSSSFADGPARRGVRGDGSRTAVADEAVLREARPAGARPPMLGYRGGAAARRLHPGAEPWPGLVIGRHARRHERIVYEGLKEALDARSFRRSRCWCRSR
jgi:DNA mismatch repair protein MutL